MALLSFKDLFHLSRQMQNVWQYNLGYEMLSVHYWVEIGFNKSKYTWRMGEFKSENNDSKDKGKSKSQLSVKLEIPSLARNNTLPIIPDELVSYILGFGPGGAVKQREYLKKLNDCYEKTKDDGIKAMLDVWDEMIPEIIENFQLNHRNPAHLTKRIVFYYCGKRIAELPKVKKYWQRHFLGQATTIEGQCVVSGKQSKELIVSAAPIKIKQVPQSLPTGSSLCSFNSSSFFAYSWEGAENAPIRAKVLIEGYAFLNFLLQDKRFHKKLSNGSLIYWSPTLTINPDLWYSEWDLDELTHSHAKGLDNESKAKALAEDWFLQRLPENHSVETGQNVVTQETDINFLFIKGNVGRSAITFFESFNKETLIKNISRFVKIQLDINCPVFFTPFNLSKTLNLGIPEINVVNSVLFGEPLPDLILLNILKDIIINKGKSNHKLLLVLYLYLNLKGKTKDNMTPKEKYAFLQGQKYWLLAKLQMIRQSKNYRATDVAWYYQYLLNNDIELQERLTTLAQDCYLEINYSSIVSKDLQESLSMTAHKHQDTLSKISELAVDNTPYTLQEKVWFVLGGSEARQKYYTEK